jgi:hypothetical protein
MKRDGGAVRRATVRWSRVGARCGEAANFYRLGSSRGGGDGGESVEGSSPIACWARSLRKPRHESVRRHTPRQTL